MAAAATALRQALRLSPDLVQARAALGLALYGMGDLDGAVEELRALVRQHPDHVQARLQLATTLMARQDWTGAGAELEEVLRQRSEELQAHYTLGVLRYTLGDLPGAVEAYRHVLALDPGHQDARYNLALTLKLAGRQAEAARELLTAAEAGVARAQYFLGAAYAAGSGVERSLPLAITWWFRAAEGGARQAEDALAQLRHVALGRGRSPAAEREAVERAFKEFRAQLWADFPGLTGGEDESVGSALLREGRPAEAVTVLIREASTLSEPAQHRLVSLYEHGVPGQLTPFDGRILAYLNAAAAEGQPLARVALARIYARGLGLPKDLGRAMSLLKTTPYEDAQRLLRELSAADDASPAGVGH